MSDKDFEWPDAEERFASAYQAVGVLLHMVGYWDSPKDSELSRQGTALLDMLSDPGNPIPDEAWTFGHQPFPEGATEKAST